MKTANDRAKIFRAVRESIEFFGGDTRNEVARRACIKLDKSGIYANHYPHLQDILIEALNKKEKEGAFLDGNFNN